MTTREAELLLESINESFGITKHDLVNGRIIYTKWGKDDAQIDIENLGHRSLKISKNLGDVYLDKVSTDAWVIVGKGTTLHCDDLNAGLGVVNDFEGFLM